MKELTPSLKLLALLGLSLFVLAFLGMGQALAQGPFTWHSNAITSTSSNAGSHPDITIEFEANDDPAEQGLESLALKWPDGLVPSVDAAAYCELTQDGNGIYYCSNPNAKKLGSQTTSMTVLGFSISLGSSTYADPPQAGEVARLVAIPDLFPSTVSTTSVRLRDNGSGIEQVTEGIPNTIDLGDGPIPIHINGLSSVFTGSDGSLTIPALCNPVSFDATFSSYGDDGVANTGDEVTLTDSEDFPINNCQAVPFNPSISLSFSSNQAGSPTNLNTDTTNNTGDAATKKMRITLPAGFTLAPSSGGACTQSQVDAQACPSGSLLGTLTISSALSSTPLSGQIYITEPKGAAIGIWVLITASFGNLELNGTLTQTATGGLEMEISDFPPIGGMGDVSLNLDSSASGAFTNPFTCGSYSASSYFESHSGLSVSRSHSLEIVGCSLLAPFATELEVKIWKTVSNRYTDTRFKLTQGTAKKLTKASFEAPKDLRFSMRRQPKKRALAYVELWGKSKVQRGRFYFSKRSRSKRKKRSKRSRSKGRITSMTLKPKNKQLKGVRLRISRSRGKTKLTLSKIPQTRELTELSIRIFGKRPRLVKTFKRCKRSKMLTFDATSFDSQGMTLRASDTVKVRCSKRSKRSRRKGKS